MMPREKKNVATGDEAKDLVEFTLTRTSDVPRDLNALEHAKEFWKEGRRTLRDQHTHRSRLNGTFNRKSLYLSSSVNLPGKSVTEDVDPEYFTMVTGRPIKVKAGMSEYLRDIRNCFLTRLTTGFHHDEILLMDERHAIETTLLSEVSVRFMTILAGFEEFLKEDHASSRVLLDAVREETNKSNSKLTELKNLRKTLKEIETEVLIVEEEWRRCKMFQRFLYLTAPAEWRKINDPEYGKSGCRESVMDPCLFDRFRDSPEESNVKLEAKILRFLDDIKTCRPPALYFSNPEQVHGILADLEKNNLRALIHCVDLDFPAANAVSIVKKAERGFQEDQARLEEDVKYLTDLVAEEENKAVRSEEKLREIAFGLFRNLITNEEYLTIVSYLEDAYEDIVAATDDFPDPVTMIKEIELKFESLALDLDKLPNSILVSSTKKFFKDQKREIAEAKEAERKVHQMEMLLKRLSKALRAPKKGRKERKIVPRSQPLEEELDRKKLPKILTKEERERTLLFGIPTDSAELVRPLCL